MIGEIYKHLKSRGIYHVRGEKFATIDGQKWMVDDAQGYLIGFTHGRTSFVDMLPEIRRDGYWRIEFAMPLHVQNSSGATGDIYWVIYQAPNNSLLFARPRDEFLDGRFERVGP